MTLEDKIKNINDTIVENLKNESGENQLHILEESAKRCVFHSNSVILKEIREINNSKGPFKFVVPERITEYVVLPLPPDESDDLDERIIECDFPVDPQRNKVTKVTPDVRGTDSGDW